MRDRYPPRVLPVRARRLAPSRCGPARRRRACRPWLRIGLASRPVPWLRRTRRDRPFAQWLRRRTHGSPHRPPSHPPRRNTRRNPGRNTRRHPLRSPRGKLPRWRSPARRITCRALRSDKAERRGKIAVDKPRLLRSTQRGQLRLRLRARRGLQLPIPRPLPRLPGAQLRARHPPVRFRRRWFMRRRRQPRMRRHRPQLSAGQRLHRPGRRRRMLQPRLPLLTRHRRRRSMRHRPQPSGERLLPTRRLHHRRVPSRRRRCIRPRPWPTRRRRWCMRHRPSPMPRPLPPSAGHRRLRPCMRRHPRHRGDHTRVTDFFIYIRELVALLIFVSW
jgi:hypothetical protein